MNVAILMAMLLMIEKDDDYKKRVRLPIGKRTLFCLINEYGYLDII